MRVKVTGGAIVLAVVAYAVVSAVRIQPFSPAADLPRGPLVYLQIEDLPEFIRLWNKSGFKDKYRNSQNFDDLSKRHLGLKIASRWQEFGDALGMPIDLDFVAGLADKRVAVAVYDIGKLDVVFIAPMNAATFEANRLMQGSDKFEDEQLDNGTHIYRVDVDADKGRQKQQVLFTHVNGRMIVATSEKLLAQTVSIITGSLRKNALADDPAFFTLAARTTPKTATVWVDQAALNSDYYFKRYWLMSNVGSLKNITSGMFGLSIGNDEIVEDREFLLKEAVPATPVSRLDAEQLMSRVPAGSPYYKIEHATTERMNSALASVLSVESNDPSGRPDRNADLDDDFGDKFDKDINETNESPSSTRDDKPIDLSGAIASAGPRAMLSVQRTKVEQQPLFADFDRGIVLSLSLPAAFDRTAFEKQLLDAMSTRLLLRGQKLDAKWTTKTDRGLNWRELTAPVLGWEVQYAVLNNQLIVSNESAFFAELLAAQMPPSITSSSSFSEVTVLDPGHIRGDYESIFNKLSSVKNDFFVGNILSLADSAPEIKNIELHKSYEGSLMRELLKITF